MRTVGHRGAPALAPENTLLAVQIAAAHGLDFAEVDVHLSRDGQLIVHHDPEVVIDGQPVAIAELTAAELGKVPKGRDQVVPTLDEVFAIAAGRIGVYVECKAQGTAAALGTRVRRRAGLPELIAGSFSPALVEELGSAASGVPRSVLFGPAPMALIIETCRSLDARYAHPCARPILRADVDQLHAAGLQVMTPHTNDPAEAERFVRLGVDLVASDDPRILAALVAAGN